MNQDHELADSWVNVDTHEDNSFTSFNSLGSSFPSTPASPRKERAGPLSPSLFQAALNRLQERSHEPEPMDLSRNPTALGEEKEGGQDGEKEPEALEREKKEKEEEEEEKLRALNLDTYDMVQLSSSMEEEISRELEKLRREEEKVPLKGETPISPSLEKDMVEAKKEKEEMERPANKNPAPAAPASPDPPQEKISRQPSPPLASSSSSSSSSSSPSPASTSLLRHPPSSSSSFPFASAPSSSSSSSSSPSSSLRPPLHSWNPTSPETLLDDSPKILQSLPKYAQSKGLRHRKTPSQEPFKNPPVLSLSEASPHEPNLIPGADAEFFEVRINRQKLSMTFLLSALFVTHIVAFGMGVICDRKLLLAQG